MHAHCLVHVRFNDFSGLVIHLLSLFLSFHFTSFYTQLSHRDRRDGGWLTAMLPQAASSKMPNFRDFYPFFSSIQLSRSQSWIAADFYRHLVMDQGRDSRGEKNAKSFPCLQVYVQWTKQDDARSVVTGYIDHCPNISWVSTCYLSIFQTYNKYECYFPTQARIPSQHHAHGQNY